MPIENIRCVVEIEEVRTIFGLRVKRTNSEYVISEGGDRLLKIGDGIGANYLEVSQTEDNRPTASLYANYKSSLFARIQNHLSSVFGFESQCQISFKSQPLTAPHVLGSTSIFVRRLK